MGLFKLFTGKSAADHERRGDDFAALRDWGKAKLAYEKALDRLESGPEAVPATLERLNAKLQQSREALAAGHLQSGCDLLEAGYPQDAAELFTLALELTADHGLKQRIAEQLALSRPAKVPEAPLPENGAATLEAIPDARESHFEALCSMLPEDIQAVYAGYGPEFKAGYVALNRGEFEQAAAYFEHAWQAQPDPDGYLPLEMASAYFNLGRTAEARDLLETFVDHHPDALPGYQLLCEIYWEQRDADSARDLLAGCPPELKASVAYSVLHGETLRQAGDFEAAKDWYAGQMRQHGWHDQIGSALAGVLEQTGELERARELHATIIGNCRGCGSRVPAATQRKYADLSMATGNFSDQVLEIYLALARQDPDNAPAYYTNVSKLYASRGQQEEARRFESIAKGSADDR